MPFGRFTGPVIFRAGRVVMLAVADGAGVGVGAAVAVLAGFGRRVRGVGDGAGVMAGAAADAVVAVAW
jgi:hypothetical protein